MVNIISAFISMVEERNIRDLFLVVAGGYGWKNQDIFSEMVKHNKVFSTGFVDDRDLSKFYSDALLFSYVSHYEGFGLPILEAMSCGAPIIAGDNSAQKDLLDDCGLLCDPNDINSIMDSMYHLYEDEYERVRYKNAAFEKSLSYDWSKTVSQTVTLYEKLIF